MSADLIYCTLKGAPVNVSGLRCYLHTGLFIGLDSK